MPKKKKKSTISNLVKYILLFSPQLAIVYLSANYFYVFTTFIAPRLEEVYGNPFFRSNKYTYATLGNILISVIFIAIYLHLLKKGKEMDRVIHALVFALQLFLFYITSVLHGLLVVRIVAIL